MNCRDFKNNFSAFIDSGLSGGLLAEAERHVNECKACARLLDAYRAGIGVFRAEREIEPPEDMFERVMAEVNSSAGPAKVVPLYPMLKRNVMAAAAVLMIALLGSLIFTGGDRIEVAWNPAVDSTIDVVNADEILPSPVVETVAARRPAQKAYLTSFNSDEEATLSYGVSHHPLIVESGVSAVGD